MQSQKFGSYAFLVAIMVALLAGVGGTFMAVPMSGIAAGIMLVLVLLGLVVGYVNIHDKHISDFLIATIAVAMISGTAGGLIILNNWIPLTGTLCVNVVNNIVAVAAAAGLVVGLKQMFALAKGKVQ